MEIIETQFFRSLLKKVLFDALGSFVQVMYNSIFQRLAAVAEDTSDELKKFLVILQDKNGLLFCK